MTTMTTLFERERRLKTLSRARRWLIRLRTWADRVGWRQYENYSDFAHGCLYGPDVWETWTREARHVLGDDVPPRMIFDVHPKDGHCGRIGWIWSDLLEDQRGRVNWHGVYLQTGTVIRDIEQDRTLWTELMQGGRKGACYHWVRHDHYRISRRDAGRIRHPKAPTFYYLVGGTLRRSPAERLGVERDRRLTRHLETYEGVPIGHEWVHQPWESPWPAGWVTFSVPNQTRVAWHRPVPSSSREGVLSLRRIPTSRMMEVLSDIEGIDVRWRGSEVGGPLGLERDPWRLWETVRPHLNRAGRHQLLKLILTADPLMC